MKNLLIAFLCLMDGAGKTVLTKTTEEAISMNKMVHSVILYL